MEKSDKDIFRKTFSKIFFQKIGKRISILYSLKKFEKKKGKQKTLGNILSKSSKRKRKNKKL